MRFALNTSAEAFSRWASRTFAALDPSQPGPVQDGLLAASDRYHETMRQRFAREGDGDWPPLAPATIREREHLGYGDHPTLRRSGDLENSLQRGDTFHFIDLTRNGITEGTQHPLAAVHHRGAPVKNLPARTILVPPNDETIDQMKTDEAVGISVAMKNAAV